MCMSVLLAYMHACAPCACLLNAGGGQKRATGIIDTCELRCKFWEPNQACQQEHQLLLMAEPSL